MAPQFSRRNKTCDHPRLATADPKVLDLAHLARYTVGNRELEVELLRLFRSQLRDQASAIRNAMDAETWKFATHTLKGVALSIGAWSIAEAAEGLEQFGHAGEVGERRRLLEALEVHTVACEREIDRIIEVAPAP